MNHTARMTALENKVNALTLIIEKQNDTITALTLRVDDHDKRLSTPHVRETEYVQQFTQWPKGVGG